MNTTHGSCLCGKVAITINPEKKIFDACHCGMCRKWGGGPALTVHGGPKFEITGFDHITVFNSSDWAERAFCKNCGTHLYYHLKGGDFHTFPLGLFKDTEDFKFDVQIFTDHKPKHYDFANATKMMTEAEVLAMFGGK
ncbi:aldehyde-activating protein [Bdellovibrio sp. qaytius]|nr:aldehyde-activating protein [Bdellovibrio sp. qaytius]